MFSISVFFVLLIPIIILKIIIFFIITRVWVNFSTRKNVSAE